MKLLTAKVFAERYFDPQCKPDVRTVRAWVEKGNVAGKLVNQHVYVDAEAWERSSGFGLVDKIMNAA